MNKKRPPQVPAEDETAPLTYAEQRTMLLISEGFDFGHKVVSAGVWVAGFYFVGGAVANLAGLNTSASFIVHWMTSSEENAKGVIFWAVLAILCAGWAFAERRLRQRKIAQLSGRIAELELIVDATRTSSGLTPEGKSPPKVTPFRRRET